MTARAYQLTVLGSVLAWFLLGLHAPALHQMTHHGRDLPVTALGATLILAACAVAGVWRLLRAPRRAAPDAASGPARPGGRRQSTPGVALAGTRDHPLVRRRPHS
jgi:hypothetical protein